MRKEIQLIRNIVCMVTGVPIADVFKPTRKKEIILARQLIQYFLYQYTDLEETYIGIHTGGKSHSTVNHSRQTISNLLDAKDKSVKDDCLKIKMMLFSHIKDDKIIIWEIKKGVPMPGKDYENEKYPFRYMEVGDSCKVLDKKDPKKYKNLCDAARYQFENYGKRFSVRTIGEEVFVWRIF